MFVCKHSCLGVPAKWPKQKMWYVFSLAAMREEGDFCYWICNFTQNLGKSLSFYEVNENDSTKKGFQKKK